MNRNRIHKLFMNYEREEAWLNKMSSEGYRLIDYSFPTYTFEPCRPSQYQYKIILLDRLPSHYKTQKYLDFLAESGVECVATHLRWAFLSKNADDGPLELFSDAKSKIKHHYGICTLFSVFFFLNLYPAITLTYMLFEGSKSPGIHFTLAALNSFISVKLFCLLLRHIKKIQRLKEDLKIYQS